MRSEVVKRLFAHQFYSNRKDVPRELRSRQEWSWEGRKVKKEAVPEAVLRVEIDGGERWQYFFPAEATERYAQPFALAYRYFARLFCAPAYRGDYIYRREAKDEGGWPHAFQPLTLGKIRQHVLGQRILGAIGFRSTNHITFDIDYHARDDRRELFLARCKVLHQELPEFFSSAFFATCKPEDVGGIHFTVLVRQMSVTKAQRAAREFLRTLDRKYPTLAAVESFTRIEVYPVAKGTGDGKGCRLPLSKGRVCITDRVLRDDPRTNCLSLVNWIRDGNRKNIDARGFLAFLARNTPEHEARQEMPKKGPAKREKKKPSGMGSIGRLKGRCLRTLFDFWDGSTRPDDDTIGKYTVVTARHIWKQGVLGEQECLNWLEEAYLALPHQSFSDRLCHDFEELMRSARNTVKAVYRGNGYQARPEESTKKLEKVTEYCQRHGILIHDRSTWSNLPGNAQPRPDFSEYESFQFTYDQRRVLKEQVHPLLHTDDVAVTYEAARRVVLFARKYPYRELAWKLVPCLCGDLAVRWHKNKCCAFLAALVRVCFLYVRLEKRWRGRRKEYNRARSYGIGRALVDNFKEKTSSNPNSGPCCCVSIISHSDWRGGATRQAPREESRRLDRHPWPLRPDPGGS